jgi:large subunit ribosomal protein L4
MAVVDILNCKAEKVSQIELEDNIFNIPVRSNVLHEVVTMQLSNKRAGSASVKHRSDVKGSRRKLFRQKGTGRARRGDIKSPLLRGGGSVFGPDPRSYSYKVPKKVKKLALKMALSSKLKEDNIIVLDKFELDKIKTKEFLSVMDVLNAKNALIITEKENKNLELSSIEPIKGRLL